MATASPVLIRWSSGLTRAHLDRRSLARLDNIYFLYATDGTTGPELQYNGAAVTTGKFGGWNPIGAVQTASGYDVTWQWSNSNSLQCGRPTATVITPAI